MSIFWRGLLIGLSIAAPVGPIGVICIRRTLADGRAAGFASGLGAATADVVYGSIAAFGLAMISETLVTQQVWLRLFGGVFLCYLGLRTFVARPAETVTGGGGEGLLKAYASTFLLTLTNPMTILSFAAIYAGLGLAESDRGWTQALTIVSGVFIGSATVFLGTGTTEVVITNPDIGFAGHYAIGGQPMKRIYVIGDSISIQYGPYLQRYLRGKMAYARKTAEDAAALDPDPPQGANGGDSEMVRAFVEAKAAAGGLDVDWVLLNCGLWDLRTTPSDLPDPRQGQKQVPLDQYRTNLLAILDAVKRTGAQPIWVRTTPCDEAVHNTRESGFWRFAADCVAYNEAADAVMQANAVPTIDLYTFTLNLGDGSDLFLDHVHFHEHVREKQAAFIAGWLTAWAEAGR